MKKSKRFLALCVAMITVLSNASMISTSADGEANFLVTNASAEIGKTATVTVSIDNNPGIISWHLYLDYDSDALEITNFAPGVYNGAASGPLTQDPFSISWGDSMNGDYTTNGTLAVITFKVKETATAGTYNLILSGDEDDFLNNDLDNVPVKFGTATFTVTEPNVAVEGITLSPTSKTLEKYGDTFNLEAKVTPATATNKKITFKSSDTSVATVDDSGLVTAVGEGNATITAKTDEGGFEAKCEVTVPHNHTYTKVPAVASTCQTQGNIEYYTCDGCNKFFVDNLGTMTEVTEEDIKLPLADHKFTKKDTAEKYLKSKATCTTPAVYYYSCEVCGEKGTETFEDGEPDKNNHVGETELRNAKEATCTEDGYTGDTYCKACGDLIEAGKVIPASHKLVKTAAKAATCTEDGNIEYYTCSECGKIFSDAEGKTEITADDTVVEKTRHKGGTATCHSKAVCEVCGEEYGEFDPHNHDGGTEIRNSKPATETEEGYTGDTYCLGCGEKIADGEVIPPHVHTLTKVDRVEPTCKKAGNIEYYKCFECGKIYSDAEGKNPITEADTILAKLEHKGGTATCHTKAVCELCGEEYGELDPTNHDGGTEVRDAKEATCTEDGYSGNTYCKGCGELLEKGGAIPALGHDLVHVEAKEPTDNEDGNIEYYVCSRCGKYFSDAEGKNEIDPSTVVIPKLIKATDISNAKVSLSAKKFNYTGSSVKPKVVVRYRGKLLIEGKDYELEYKNSIKPGKATVTVNGIGEYESFVSKNYIIVPGKVKINSVSSDESGEMEVTWTNDGTVDGYQILVWNSRGYGYKTSVSKFDMDADSSSTTITGLIPGARYYVKIRAYKMIDGEAFYGKYGDSKSVKVKGINWDFGSGFGYGYGPGFGYGYGPGFGYGYGPGFGYGYGPGYGWGSNYGRPTQNYVPRIYNRGSWFNPYFFYRF